jgi:hypothetical protein
MRIQDDQIRMFGMAKRMTRLRSLVCFAVLTAVPLAAAVAQSAAPSDNPSSPAQAAPTPPTPAQPAGISSPEKSPAAAGNHSQAPEPNAQPKSQLALDTSKLLQLANELKAEMDKSSKDTLSLGVVKKAEEIEKLARKVRSEMKASIGN